MGIWGARCVSKKMVNVNHNKNNSIESVVWMYMILEDKD